jgi:hypothetical protein
MPFARIARRDDCLRSKDAGCRFRIIRDGVFLGWLFSHLKYAIQYASEGGTQQSRKKQQS